MTALIDAASCASAEEWCFLASFRMKAPTLNGCLQRAGLK